MQTREVVYKDLLISQRWENGRFVSYGARPITDAPTMTDTTAPTKALSGSSNDHARLAPSDAKRWLNCTASIAYEKENEERIFKMAVESVINLTPYLKSIPDELHEHEGRAMRWARDVKQGRCKASDLTEAQKKDIWRTEGNVYSREGTRAHDFASAIFAGDMRLEDIPEEFQHPVGYYIDFCKGFLEGDESYFVETKVPLFYNTKETGTRDFGIIRDERITIIDYKHGAGDLVEAKENPQCTIYGLSTIDELEATGLYDFDPDTIVDIWIVQPRHHADKPAKQWEISLRDLKAYRDEIQATHDQIVEGRDLKFAPSDSACRYCKCKSFCPARAAAATDFLDAPDYSGIDLLAGLPDLPDDVKTKKAFNELPPAGKMTKRLDQVGRTYGWDTMAVMEDETRVALMLNKKAIISFLEDNEEDLAGRVLSGEKIKGLKIVMGRQGDRMWSSEEAADKLLSGRLKADERYTKKLISVTTAEKLIDLEKENPRFKKAFANLITRSDARKTVAPESDKREAVNADSSDLEDIPEDEEFEFPEGM